MGDMKKLSLLEAMEREAREIERELEQHPELDEIYVTDEMDAALFAKIQAYEESKEKENREKPEESSKERTSKISGADKKKTVTYRKKSKKKYIVFGLAAVLAIVMGTGIVGVGNKSYWKEVFQREYGEDELNVIKVEDMDDIQLKGKEHSAIYNEVSDKLGVSIVSLRYKPQKLEFLKMEIAENMQSARIFYDYKGEVLRYTIYLNHSDSERAENIEDKKVNEYTVHTLDKNMEIKVKEYQVPEYQELRRCAEFEYKGIYYQLKGKMNKEEFDKILENLYFL